jgi:HpcH/HpaI aldolase/citrate lyase family protein
MASFGDDFRFTLITRDPGLAQRGDSAGIDRIGIDIERFGKSARQNGMASARISDHELSDLDLLAPSVQRAALFARLNPLHAGSRQEVEAALAGGATVLMLPYFKTAAEVDQFVGLVGGRAKIVLLLETMPAVVRLHDILAVSGINEVMVGLNDLHLSAGLTNRFELIASDVLMMVAEAVRARGIGFGFGGVARLGDQALPIPADLVLAQHARLGSTSAWISRSFFNSGLQAIDVGIEIARLRERLSFWAAQPKTTLLAQRDALRRLVR